MNRDRRIAAIDARLARHLHQWPRSRAALRRLGKDLDAVMLHLFANFAARRMETALVEHATGGAA